MNILLLDDDDGVLEVVESCLVDDHHTVRAVTTAEAALSLVGSGACPDLLLTDFNLGGALTGLDVAQQVRRSCPSIGVIVITGRPDLAEAHRPALPAVSVLPKPLRIGTLLAAVGACGRR